MIVRAYRTAIAASLVLIAAASARGADGAFEKTYRSRRDSARDAYEGRLYLLARTALQNGLGEEGLMFLREILIRDPEHARARDMSRKLEAYLEKRGTPVLSAQQRRVHERNHASMMALADRERAKHVRKIVTLAKLCDARHYDVGLKESIADGLALDPECVALRTLNGEKRHRMNGWLASNIVDHMNGGEWIEDGKWKPWTQISARRIESLKKRQEGAAFSYSAGYHFTMASSLKDKTFEKKVLVALEMLVREQYREFYSHFHAGIPSLDVVYFETKQEFQAYVRRHGLSFSDAMGFYDWRVRTLYAWRHDGTMTNGIGTVFHEATHGTLKDLFGDRKLPLWLNEGLASFHEKTRPVAGGIHFGPINIPRMGELEKALRAGTHVTMGEVFKLDGMWRQKTMYCYNLSAMFIHFLYGRGLLKAFINEMYMHSDPDKAVRNVLGPDQSAWDKVFDAYVHDEVLAPDAYEKMRAQMRGSTVD